MADREYEHPLPPRDEARASCDEPSKSGVPAVATPQAVVEDREPAGRDRAAARRDKRLRTTGVAAPARDERDGLIQQLRGANEHLVLATVRAEALAEKAAHLAAIVESTADAVFSMTLEGVVRSWNRGAERIFGYTEEEMIGASVTLLVPPAHEQESSIVLGRARRGETTDWLETMRLRKDGKPIDVALTISPIRNELGRVVATSEIARDITEWRRAEEERKELLRSAQTARAEAEAATRLKDEFLAMVSHELRSPLSAVLGWVRLIATRQLREPDFLRAVETIERNGVALARIIDDLLDVSRIVAGKLAIAANPVDLVAVARAAVDAVGPLAAQKRIELVFAAHPNTKELVKGDAVRLQQVIANLLTNAIKFTPEGGRVEASVARVDAEMLVTVADTGQGIAPAFLPHVFEQFRQADAGPGRRQGGLGLGLAIVERIVKLHGGTVHAASAGEGRGSTFTIRLPKLAAARSHRRPRSAALSRWLPPRLNGVRVLVVDGDVDSRQLTVLLLAQAGATVDVSASAQEALETLRSEPPDVMVTDIELPDDDGYALLRRMHDGRLPQDPWTPAIALTAQGGAEDRRRAITAGFRHCLVKPFDASELIEAIVSLTRQAGNPP